MASNRRTNTNRIPKSKNTTTRKKTIRKKTTPKKKIIFNGETRVARKT